MSSAAVNADWSNRRPPARSAEQLKNRLMNAVNRAGVPPFFAVSELSNGRVVRSFEAATVYAGTHAGRYPRVYLAHNTGLFESVGACTDGNHYVAQRFQSKAAGHIVLTVGVHMPRTHVGANYQNLMRFLEEQRADNDVDSIAVRDDFNQKPAFLKNMFGDMQVVLDEDHGPTTLSSRSLDNIIYSYRK